MDCRFRKLVYYTLGDNDNSAVDGVMLTTEREMPFFPRTNDIITIGPIVNLVDKSNFDVHKGAFVEFHEEKMTKSTYQLRIVEHGESNWRVEEQYKNGTWSPVSPKVSVRKFIRD